MKVGNIIYKNELVNHERVEHINYIDRPTHIDQIKNGLPTLYVGWNFLKETNKHSKLFSGVDILNKEILPRKIYWEFAFHEKKSEHINGVVDFVLSAPLLYFTNKYQYQNINPIFSNIKSLDDLKKDKRLTNFDVFFNYKNRMIYLLDIIINENFIYGLDLELFKYLDFDIEELINYFKSLSVRIVEDFDGEKSAEIIENYGSDDELLKYLPILFNK